MAEYNLAHKNGYIVRADLSKCIWNLKLELPNDKGGSIYCELADTTLDRSSGKVLSGSSIPFGWSHTGSQIPVELKVIKENGVWLIDEDSTGGDPS